MENRSVAFLGLGMMGAPMAARLVTAGFEVRGYDPVTTARAALIDAGGQAFEDAATAVDGAAICITMLPNGKIVRDALLDGSTTVVSRLAKGAIVIDMSSSAPVGTQQLAEELSLHGIELVDAPVSGGVARARNGTLAIMAGGMSQSIAKVRPVLEAMGEAIFETGEVGSGHAMKALNNYVSATGLIAACEAVQVGSRFGLDPEVMIDVFNASTGRNNSTQVKMKPFVIGKTYASGFSLALMAKDLRTADDLARQLQVPAPLSAACTALWEAASEQLGSSADHTEIDRFLATAQKADSRAP